ncbi:MAG: hypothetical protein KAJ14_12855, partial [Candidatus Omnitrophica bacterium]|nr:hypothetical protein [Candidatus Omnitrophota bacterium]
AWDIPETIGVEAGGNGYRIKVVDSDNADTDTETPIFTVEGDLQITLPDGQQPSWKISETKTITWDISHGNMQNVKIIGSRSGTFSGEADEFVVVNSTPADNAVAFNALNIPVARGSFDWNINEYTPSIIADTIKLKVLDANTDYSVDTTSSAAFTVTGNISVTSPASGVLWKVGDTDKTVAWNCDGVVTEVDIQFSSNGVAGPWSTIASGVTSDAGSNTWSTANWVGGAGVSDAKSVNSMIRVKDTQFNVIGDSQEFKVYPIMNVTTPVEDQLLRAESSGNIVSWETPGSTKISNVDIYLDFQGGSGGYPSQPITNWSAGSPCSTIVLPSNLSESAVFKVVDVDNDEIYGISSQFKIHGNFDIVDTPIADWTVGSSQDITWTHKGDIGTINIYISYNDGTDYTQIGTA